MISFIKIRHLQLGLIAVITIPLLANAEDAIQKIPDLEQVSLESLSGIYATDGLFPNPSWKLSIHINDDIITIIDLTEDLSLLSSIDYITKEEAEQNIKLSAPDKIFYGKITTIDQGLGSYNYSGYLNPLLPASLRASDNTSTYPSGLETPIKCEDNLLHCGSDGTFINFIFYSYEGIQRFSLFRDNAVFYYSYPATNGYLKLF